MMDSKEAARVFPLDVRLYLRDLLPADKSGEPTGLWNMDRKCARIIQAMIDADTVPVPRAELERLIAHASCSQSMPGHYRISVPEHLWAEVIGKALEAKERGNG